MNTRKTLGSIVIGLIVIGLIASTIPQTNSPADNPPAKAQFVLTSWNYPDEYGQGIYNIRPQENSSGAWLNFVVPPWVYSDNASVFDINNSISIKLLVAITVNYTLLDLIDPDDFTLGRNFVRLNVTVTNSSSTVFSQNNLTYVEGAKIETGIWYYSYEVVLNFVTAYAQIYRATVTCEVFYK